MSYLKVKPSSKPDESIELAKYIISKFQDAGLVPKKKSAAWGLTKEQIAALMNLAKVIGIVILKVTLAIWISKFTFSNLKKIAIREITKNQKNKALAEYLRKEIRKVYQTHPGYTNCTLEQFEKTSVFAYMTSEFRDKTALEKAERITDFAIKSLIDVASGKLLPIPFAMIWFGPLIRIFLTYTGLNMGISSVYTMCVKFGNQTLQVGVDVKPLSFVLRNIWVYSFNKDGELVATRIPDPPYSIYKITKKDIDEMIDKYGLDDDLTKLKREVVGQSED